MGRSPSRPRAPPGRIPLSSESSAQSGAPDHRARRQAKEPRGGVAIPTRLAQDVDDLAILVDSPPEVQALAADRHEKFVQMPRIADGPRPTSESSRVGRTERLAPLADGLVRHRDAALGEEVFDVAEAEGESVLEPDRVADDRGREPVAEIVRDVGRHPASVPAVTSS